jgi:hypothetical protein
MKGGPIRKGLVNKWVRATCYGFTSWQSVLLVEEVGEPLEN